MTLSTKNKFMLFGAIGLIQSLLTQKLISQDIYNEFIEIIYAEDNDQQLFIQTFVQQFKHKPLKRGRKKIEILFICENIPIALSDEITDLQDDEENMEYMRLHHPSIQ
jgi:hypothetical protein